MKFAVESPPLRTLTVVGRDASTSRCSAPTCSRPSADRSSSPSPTAPTPPSPRPRPIIATQYPPTFAPPPGRAAVPLTCSPGPGATAEIHSNVETIWLIGLLQSELATFNQFQHFRRLFGRGFLKIRGVGVGGDQEVPRGVGKDI